MKNNLFNYATKELSQDAFICWLMSYAMKDAKKDEGLCQCAKDFIKQFLEDEDVEEIWVTNIQRQYKSIDVLITINDKYLILIEDKTYTEEHDDQLSRYKKVLKDDFPEKIIRCVFWKTGFQSDYSNINENNYLLFERESILKTLEKYTSEINNQIFLDYYEFIKKLNNEIMQFKVLPISVWKWQQINGFYDYLNKSPEVLGGSFASQYGYIANPSGGFYGMWLSNDTYKQLNGIQLELYLQLEFTNNQLNICYKASAGKTNRKINRDLRYELLGITENGQWINIAQNHHFEKPSRYGCGKTVTLGVFEEKPENYEEAIKIIKKALCEFTKMTQELNSCS